MKKKNIQTDCESCMYFDYDEAADEDICTLDLDEDEMESFVNCTNRECPYFDFFDEYKLVQKQN